MRRPLNARERRGAAVILLALLLWAAWWLLVQSWFTGPLSDIDAQLQDLREQQQRYAGQLAQKPLLQQQLEQARRDPASRSSLLPGDDLSAVAAQLMQHSVELIKAHADEGPGCELTQRMPITPEQDSAQPYRQVKVSLTLDCAAEPLAHLLHDIEYSQPMLFVDSLSIRRNPAASGAGGPGRLRVHLLVSGYLQPAGAKESAQ
jgi:general secretion pathway protein M